jgi:hypothetical protein
MNCPFSEFIPSSLPNPGHIPAVGENYDLGFRTMNEKASQDAEGFIGFSHPYFVGKNYPWGLLCIKVLDDSPRRLPLPFRTFLRNTGG